MCCSTTPSSFAPSSSSFVRSFSLSAASGSLMSPMCADRRRRVSRSRIQARSGALAVDHLGQRLRDRREELVDEVEGLLVERLLGGDERDPEGLCGSAALEQSA